MLITKYIVQACCGKTSVIFKTDQPLDKNHISSLIKLGFVNHDHFQKAGILYVDNLDFIMTGPLGANKLQVKCKTMNCDQKIDELEALLLQI